MLDDAQIQDLKNCASRQSFYVPPLQYEQTVFFFLEYANTKMQSD